MLLVIIHIFFISLGPPDGLLGSAWPSMYENLAVPVSFAGIISLIYPDGDYGFCSYHVGHINCLIAGQYHRLQDIRNAVLHLEKGLYFSKVYDELPVEVKHTSLLLKDDIENLSEVYNGTQMNRVAYEINEFENVLSGDTSEKAYMDLLKKYIPFAKSI